MFTKRGVPNGTCSQLHSINLKDVRISSLETEVESNKNWLLSMVSIPLCQPLSAAWVPKSWALHGFIPSPPSALKYSWL